LLGIAVFGFLGINFMNAHHASCIVSTSQGGFCTEKIDPLGFINFHFNTLKGFSTAVFGSGLQIALLAAMFLIIYAMFWRSAFASFAAKKATIPKFSIRALSVDEAVSSSKRKFIGWLSLRENSPSLSPAAA